MKTRNKLFCLTFNYKQKGDGHVLTNDQLFLTTKFSFMKKKVSIASTEKKSIVKNAIQSSENEQLDLYKAVFGGVGADCPVVAVARLGAAAGYDKHDTFLRAATL